MWLWQHEWGHTDTDIHWSEGNTWAEHRKDTYDRRYTTVWRARRSPVWFYSVLQPGHHPEEAPWKSINQSIKHVIRLKSLRLIKRNLVSRTQIKDWLIVNRIIKQANKSKLVYTDTKQMELQSDDESCWSSDCSCMMAVYTQTTTCPGGSSVITL